MNFTKEKRKEIYAGFANILETSKGMSNLSEADEYTVEMWIPTVMQLIEDCDELQRTLDIAIKGIEDAIEMLKL